MPKLYGYGPEGYTVVGEMDQRNIDPIPDKTDTKPNAKAGQKNDETVEAKKKTKNRKGIIADTAATISDTETTDKAGEMKVAGESAKKASECTTGSKKRKAAETTDPANIHDIPMEGSDDKKKKKDDKKQFMKKDPDDDLTGTANAAEGHLTDIDIIDDKKDPDAEKKKKQTITKPPEKSKVEKDKKKLDK